MTTSANRGFAGTRQTFDHRNFDDNNLFTLPPYQSRYEKKEEICYSVNVSEESGPYKVTITGNNQQYLQTKNMLMVLNLQLQRSTGERVTYEDVSFLNNIGNSLFDSVQVDINNKPVVELTQEQYAHKAYIETITSYQESADANSMHPRCFIFDEPGTYDELDIFKNYGSASQVVAIGTIKESKVPELARGSSVWERQSYALDKSTFQVVTPLSIDVLQAHRLFPPNTSISLTFKRKHNDFYMLKPIEKDDDDATLDDVNQYKIKIMDMLIVVPYVTLVPELKLSDDKNFAEGKQALLPWQKVFPFRKQFTAGVTELSFDNVITGELPKHLICMMIDTKAFEGTSDTNPFLFRNNNASKAYLRIDNRITPVDPIITDFQQHKYAHAYVNFLRNIGLTDLDSRCMITMPGYRNDYTMFAWDLTPDQCNNTEAHKIETGNIDIKIALRSPLTVPTTLFVLATYNKVLALDAYRNVNVVSI